MPRNGDVHNGLIVFEDQLINPATVIAEAERLTELAANKLNAVEDYVFGLWLGFLATQE